MRADGPIAPATAEWTDENPGILLIAGPGGPFSAMALFFRITWSPDGQGPVLLLSARPDGSGGMAQRDNVLLSDNPTPAGHLKTSFIAVPRSFRNVSTFDNQLHIQVLCVRTDSDLMGYRYIDAVAVPGMVVQLVWEDLKPPRTLELPPELPETKRHSVSALLVPTHSAQIIVDGGALQGKPARTT